MPIIACRGLIATNFSGGSLSTIPFSYIMVDPDIPQVKELRSWVEANTNTIKGTAQKPSSSYLESTVGNKESVEITKVSLIQPDTKNVHIKGAMAIPNIEQKIDYSTCPKCFQITKAQGNEEFYCNTCDTDQIAVPRCKISVELEDISGNITATLFDKCAEKLLHQSASRMHEMNPHEIQNLLAKTNEELKSTTLIVEIRASNKKYTDKKTRYTVHDWTQSVVNEPSTSAIKESTEEIGGTPEKEGGQKVRTSQEETPEAKQSKRQEKAHEATHSAPLKKVKLEFPDKAEPTSAARIPR